MSRARRQMAREFKLPDIGEGVHEGEVVKWFVKEGDPIRENDPVVEVMTDKVTVQTRSHTRVAARNESRSMAFASGSLRRWRSRTRPRPISRTSKKWTCPSSSTCGTI